MPDEEQWRVQDETAYLERAQRAGFAWEFLRRNPRYREDYEIMSRHLASGNATDKEAALALAQRWGLSFPVQSGPTERASPDAVAGRTSTDRRVARKRPKTIP